MIELILAEDIPEIAKSGDTILLKDDDTFEIKKADGTIIQKPFAGYSDFKQCISQNRDKNDPEAYCGSIKHKVEDEVNKIYSHSSFNLDSSADTQEEKEKKRRESKVEDDKVKNRKISDVNKIYDPRIEKYLPNDKAKAWSILEKFYKTNKYFDANEVLKEFINKVALCPDVTEKFDKIMEDWMKDGEADVSTVEKIINSCKKEEGNVVVKTIIDEVLKEKHGAAHSSHAQTCPVCRHDIEEMPAKMRERLEGKKVEKEDEKPSKLEEQQNAEWKYTQEENERLRRKKLH